MEKCPYLSRSQKLSGISILDPHWGFSTGPTRGPEVDPCTSNRACLCNVTILPSTLIPIADFSYIIGLVQHHVLHTYPQFPYNFLETLLKILLIYLARVLSVVKGNGLMGSISDDVYQELIDIIDGFFIGMEVSASN